jgi:DNA-binding response OmpR family regulator
LHSQLTDIGYDNVRGFTSAREAREACKGNPPDILIVSSNMGDVSTVELVQRCRLDHPDLRVVTTSGMASTSDNSDPLQKLADATLISPIGMWELRQTMRTQISALDAAAS